MRLAAIILALAVMALGHGGLMVGGSIAAAEMQRAPAVLAAVALLVLRRGPGALPAAAGWMVLGTAIAVPLRDATGFPGPGRAIPGDADQAAEALGDAGWLVLLAVLAWHGLARQATGPLIAAVVATTRIGGYGQAMPPILWEDTPGDALRMGIGVGAGLLAGVAAVLIGGWAVSILARIPESRVPPTRVLSALAVLAALGHMLRV